LVAIQPFDQRARFLCASTPSVSIIDHHDSKDRRRPFSRSGTESTHSSLLHLSFGAPRLRIGAAQALAARPVWDAENSQTPPAGNSASASDCASVAEATRKESRP
jgi:hypothetical protein